MAAFLAKYSRMCGSLIRARSNGWLLAHKAREPRHFLNACIVPSITLMNSFGSQISTEDDLFASNEDLNEELFSLVTLVVKGSDEAVLDSYTQFVTRAAKILDIDISGRTVLQTHFKKRTVLKSPHIYKKHRSQYELRTHGRMMKMNNLTCDTADVFLEYIQRNLPEGVSMNVEQTEVMDIPEYIRPPIQIIHETIEKKPQDAPLVNQVT